MSAQDLSVTAHVCNRPVINSSRQHMTYHLQLTLAHDHSVTGHVSTQPVSNSSP